MPTLIETVSIRAPIERCFDLARSIDFHEDAARSIRAKAVGGKTRGLSGAGDSTCWQATFFGLSFRLTTRIQDFTPSVSFSDVMTQGLFKNFSHHYRFTIQDDRTQLEDRFVFESPLGFLSGLLDRGLLLKPMRRAQNERLRAIKFALENGEADKYLDRPNVT